MNISKLTRAVALSVTAAAFSAGASAVTITNPSGTFDFGGFDWASSGAAWTNNLTVAEQAAGAGNCSGPTPAAACNFTITYVALAAAVYDSNGIDLGLSAGGMDTVANGAAGPFGNAYEYTIYATINATMTQFTAGGGSGGADFLKYVVNPSSTFTIYYDNTPDALQQNGAWSGFNNGTPMVQGNWASLTEQSFDAGAGGQTLNVAGAVSMSGSQFSPALTGTIVSSTLQLFPLFSATFAVPTSVDGTVLPAVGLQDPEALFRADTNQDFFVPEPTALALSAMALLAMGATARRRRQG